MAYVKNTWVDREGQTRYHETIDDDGALIFTPDYEKVTEIGTPVNADNMNHIEDGIEDHENRITVLEEAGDASNFLNKSQITNCITEIPQRIKYDIADGVITIKAGTIIIVPYGTEDLTADFPVGSVFLNDKFKVVDSQFSDGKFFVRVELQSNLSGSGTGTQIVETSVIVNITGGSLTGLATSLTTSSSSQASGTNNANYRTDLNVVQFIRSGALNSNIGSFPLLTTKSDGVNIFASASQVFNGMGYIGSTVWVDKGVKGLIPNGRNEDGTLNNIEFTTEKVTTISVSDPIKYFGIKLEGGLKAGVYGDWLYNESTNTVQIGNDIYTWMYGGALTCTNGVISNFQPKQPFRAVDYNDFDTKVNKAGDRMSGNLIIDTGANQAVLTLKSDMLGLGDKPTSDSNNTTICMYKKGDLSAILQNATLVDGTNRFQLALRNPANTTWYSLLYGVTADNKDYFVFPKCTTKATTTSSAANDKVAVITQNYKNGTSWYRVWSDGWIEQGGSFGSEYLSYANKEFTFLKPFSDANYNVQATNGATGSFYCPAIMSKSKTSFQLRDTVNYSGFGNWYACGY